MIPKELYFVHEEALFHLLWLFPFFALFLFSTWKGYKERFLLADQRLLPLLYRSFSWLWNPVKWLCFFLGWSFAVLALMQPSANEVDSALFKRDQPLDVYFLIDTSQSMGVEDREDKKSRLTQAKEIADALLSRLKGDEVSLISFTSHLQVILPLTYDRVFARLLLRDIHLNEGDHYGTDFVAALTELQGKLSPYLGIPKAIIFLSDGGDNQKMGSEEEKDFLKAAEKLKAPLFTIGIGSKEGGIVPETSEKGKPVTSRLEDTFLKRLSQKTGGNYYEANNYTPVDLGEILSIRLKKQQENSFYIAKEGRKVTEYFQIPLALSCLFFSLAYFLPFRFSRVFPLLIFLFPSFGYATDLGASFYDSGRYDEAAHWYLEELEEFPPLWLQDKLFYNRGTSLLADQKYEAAALSFAQISKEAYQSPLFGDSIVKNLSSTLQKMSLSDEERLLWNNKLPLKEKLELSRRILDQIDNPLRFIAHAIQFLGLLKISKLAESEKGAILISLKRFYRVVYDWQMAQYQKGICQCFPWNIALPRFSEGLSMIQERFTPSHILYAYLKWNQVYELLQKPTPPSPMLSEKQLENIRELQEMHGIDKKRLAPLPKGGDIPW